MNPYCGAEYTPLEGTCTRSHLHAGHHCDSSQNLAWDHDGPFDTCPQGYEHGSPSSRAERRGHLKAQQVHRGANIGHRR